MARTVLKEHRPVIIMHVRTEGSAMRPMNGHWRRRRGHSPTGKAILSTSFRSAPSLAGYSLVEVVIATGIIALVYGVIITGYIQCGLRAQWSGYSLAAQTLANQQVEQARSAIWDPFLVKNEITNLNLQSIKYTSTNKTWSGYVTTILDVPYLGTNFTIATNYVYVQLINMNNSSNPPVQIHMVRVDTVWPFHYRDRKLYFTNTSATLLAPDNRDPSAL
jgi:hypothetical protein